MGYKERVGEGLVRLVHGAWLGRVTVGNSELVVRCPWC